MRYLLRDDKLIMADTALERASDFYVETVAPSAFKHPEKTPNAFLEVGEESRHTSVWIFPDYIYGAVHHLNNLPKKEDTSYFYVTAKGLTIIERGQWFETKLQHLCDKMVSSGATPMILLAMLLEELLDDNSEKLDAMDARLEQQEEDIIENNSALYNNMDHLLQAQRRSLMHLKRHYQQLANIGSAIAESPYAFIGEEERRYFRFLANKATHLYADARDLQEYAIQLGEMLETDRDNRQNALMEFLTIVATIFMPLTLLTGWYGMNFVHMPELSKPYAYPIVIVVAVTIVVLEIIFIIKKRGRRH